MNENSCGLSIGLLVEFYRRENELKCVAIKELMNMHNRDAKIYAEIFDKAKKMQRMNTISTRSRNCYREIKQRY